MQKRISPAVIIGLLISLPLIASPFVTPRGIGTSTFVFFLLPVIGLWILLIALCFLPFKGRLGHIARTARRIMIILSALGASILAAAEIHIILGSSPSHSEDYDAVIILGAGLYGETPSAALDSRLREGRDALRENPESLALLTGGQGPGERITEAEAMRRFLVSAQIAEERILLEDKAESTEENLKFSKEILDSKLGAGNYRVLIVTNEFHIARSLLLAKRIGLEAEGRAAVTPNVGLLRFSAYLREGFALTAAVLGISV